MLANWVTAHERMDNKISNTISSTDPTFCQLSYKDQRDSLLYILHIDTPTVLWSTLHVQYSIYFALYMPRLMLQSIDSIMLHFWCFDII